MKPRLAIGRRPHAWLAVLFAALFAAGLSAQMPDPRQMSGQVLPSAGDVVQTKGTRWVCEQGHTANGSFDHSCFRLWEKSGHHDQR